MSEVNALALSPADTVAVALTNLPAGAMARLRTNDGIDEMRVPEFVPFGHKLALRAMAAGAPVIKYGVVIASAVTAIAAGQHVHVHNIASNRARSGA